MSSAATCLFGVTRVAKHAPGLGSYTQNAVIVVQPQITKKPLQASYLNDERLLLLGFAELFALMYIRKPCKFSQNKI